MLNDQVVIWIHPLSSNTYIWYPWGSWLWWFGCPLTFNDEPRVPAGPRCLWKMRTTRTRHLEWRPSSPQDIQLSWWAVFCFFCYIGAGTKTVPVADKTHKTHTYIYICIYIYIIVYIVYIYIYISLSLSLHRHLNRWDGETDRGSGARSAACTIKSKERNCSKVAKQQLTRSYKRPAASFQRKPISPILNVLNHHHRPRPRPRPPHPDPDPDPDPHHHHHPRVVIIVFVMCIFIFIYI